MEMSRIEHILRYALGEVSTLPPNLSRIENLLIELIGEIPSTITVDDTLSDSSENPVQNKTLNAIINGTGSGSIYSKIMMAIAEVIADAPEDFDTLKEISDWISSHEDSAAAMNSAIQANTTAITGKVDKETGKGLSTEDYTAAEKTKLSGIATEANKTIVDTDLSSTSTNPVQNKAVQAPFARLIDAGAKNLLKVTATSQTINGVTFTVNDDGTITVNGNNTGELTALFTIFDITLPPNIYRLSGCPVGGSLDSYYIGSLYTDDWQAFLNDTGTGASRQLSASKTIRFQIGVRPGITVSNLTFKPMLCTAEDYAISHEFVPYAPTMREMYENKSDMSAVGLRLVASSILNSNTPYTYQMNMNDFDKNAIGTYIISIMTWSMTPQYSLYAVSYTGASLSYTSIVKIAGADMTVTIEDGVISMSGLPSHGGKISIHALQ